MAVAPIITAITAQTLQGALIRFALSLAVSYITQKLFGPDMPGPGQSGNMADPGVKQRIPTDPANKLPVVYGEDKIHGSIIFADISSDNQTMAFMIALCEGPIDSINQVTWDDWDLTLASTGWVSGANHPDGSTDDWLNDNLRIIKYPQGGRCLEMEAFSSKWASNASTRTMPDVAYIYAELKYDRENNVTGLTTKLGFEVKGKLIRTINSNGTFSGGFTPANATMRSQLDYPDTFDNATKFTDFSGNQIKGWVYSYSGGYSTSFGRGHSKVGTNGTYSIIDLGPASDPNAQADLNAYLNGTPAVGNGSGAEIEFDFVEVGEQHISNHSSSNPQLVNFSPTSYVDQFGVTQPDDGTRIINGLNIKQWGNNYTASGNDNVAGNAETRVWLKYNWTDVHGVNHDEYYVLVTFQFTPTGTNYTNWTENDYAERMYEELSKSWNTGGGPFTGQQSDIRRWGGRRYRTSDYTDSSGNSATYTYLDHHQYFTAKVPASILSFGFGTYSNNPAECLADYLTSKVYGCGHSVSDSDLDLDTFYDHKVFCDTLVTHNDPNGNSVTSKRYECNGFVNTNDDKDLNISDIISNSQSIFSYTLGKFQMITDTTGSSRKTFDEQNIYGDITILNDGFNSTLNELTLKFKSQQDNYQDDQVFLDYGSKYFNEPILSKDLDLKFINSNVQAQRLGTVLMNKSRSAIIISFKTDSNASNLQVNDVITVEDTYYNFDTPRKLYLNFTNTSNTGTTSTNTKGVFRLYDGSQYQDVKYPDGTKAIITTPYNVATYDQLKTFFYECMHGMYEDTTGTLTIDELKANNQLGYFISLNENNSSFTTGGTYGGGFIFTLTPEARRSYSSGNYYNIEWRVDAQIPSASASRGVESNGSVSGKQFKINSISETELKGGVQGYYITAQEYNADDYTVATLTAKAVLPNISSTKGFTSIGVATNLNLVGLNDSDSVPNVEFSFQMPNQSNVEGVEVYYSDGANGTKYFAGSFVAPTGTFAANSVQQYQLIGIPTTADLYLFVKLGNSFAKGAYSTGLSCGSWSPVNASTNVGTNSVSTTSIQTGAVGTNQLSSTLDLSAKTVILANNMKNTPSFEAYLSADQTITSGTETKLEIDTEDFDDGSSYDNATNFRFLPTTAGKYYVYAQTQINSSDDFDGSALIIKKNGSAVATHAKRHEDNEYYNVSKIIQLNGTTDYVEVFGYQNSGSDKDFSGGAAKTYFGAYKLIN